MRVDSFNRSMQIGRFNLVSEPKVDPVEKVFVMPGHAPMTRTEYERVFVRCLYFSIANDPRQGGRWVDPSFSDL